MTIFTKKALTETIFVGTSRTREVGYKQYESVKLGIMHSASASKDC